MRLSLKVNGNPRVVAAVNGPGYLSAHLNLHERPKDNDYSKSVRVVGVQTLETETERFEWPEYELQTGDSAELNLLNDGVGDPALSEDRPNHLTICAHIPTLQERSFPPLGYTGFLPYGVAVWSSPTSCYPGALAFPLAHTTAALDK